MPLNEVVVVLILAVTGATLISGLLLLLLSWQQPVANDPLFGDGPKPGISVLLAARNEAAVIGRCLDSLVSQKYPADKLEILVGDDDSDDNTGQIVVRYEKEYPFVKGHRISEKLGLARGKSNVLAQLARQAKGDVFLITDADMWLPPSWCGSMVGAFERGDGIVTGYTAVSTQTFFGKMQAVEWALAIGMIKILTDMGRPVSSMGNNMAVLAEAYRATGGYESLPFSLTEDFQLSREVLRKGYSIRQLIDPAVKGVTLPTSLAGFTWQRKRWMRGAVQLPWWMVAILVVQTLYYPFAVAGVFLIPWFWLVVLAKCCLQTAFCVGMTRKAGEALKIGVSLSYELYSALISLPVLLYSILPGRVKWKGRYY